MQNKLKYLIVGFLALAGCAVVGVGKTSRPKLIPQTSSEFAKAAVMITNADMTSGGTGVILNSRPGNSTILTNKHVCELIQIGGKVTTDEGKSYPIKTFQAYKYHDLCLISVVKDLGVNIKVAKESPALYSPSIVVGHPALLPTIVTPGHFSQIKTIQLMMGTVPCDGSEEGQDALYCALYGEKPLLISYEAQITSSTIMPGSSGSGVFNSKGELSALVFAGMRGLSYGMVVPWEYINDFLTHLKSYPPSVPDPSKKPQSLFGAQKGIQHIQQMCQQGWDKVCKDGYWL